MITRCPACQARLRVDAERIPPGGGRARCPRCGLVFRVSREAPVRDPNTILVASDGPVLRETVSLLLREAGYRVVEARDGVEAILRLERERPAAVVLDAALPKLYGIEVSERIKRNPKTRDTVVILLASVYDKTGYKREPQALYGADDYLEKHHIQDALVPMLRIHLERRPVKDTVRVGRAVVAQRQGASPGQALAHDSIREEEVAPRPPALPSGVSQEQIEKARRFARLIISDIALYNQDRVEEGIRHNTLQALLRKELAEGLALYESRVAPEVQALGNFYQEALEEFIAKKRRSMHLESPGPEA